jgi:hypothetical protein
MVYLELTMTQFIKDFIEKNIQLIENDKWRDVFLAWYDDAEDLWPEDKAEFKQFISILHDVALEPDLDVAHSVIRGIIEDKIITEKNYMFQTKHVSIFAIVNNLNSFLGHSEQDIKKIIDETATKLGMRYTEYYGGGYTW